MYIRNVSAAVSFSLKKSANRMTSRTALRAKAKDLLGLVAVQRLRRAQRAIFGNPKPKQFFSLDDVVEMPAKEVARALSLAVLYAYTAEVEGDIAEFGTMSGSTAQAIAVALVASEARSPQLSKRLHLFDSFEGLPEIASQVDAASPHVTSGLWVPGGCKVLSQEELRKVVLSILPSHRLAMHKGWFADTNSALPDDTRFSMIHFDGDLYQSTIDALSPCFARGFVSEGAIICFDDWNCNRASNNFGERKAWMDLVRKYNIRFSAGGDYSHVCSRVIVHSYDRVGV